MPVVPTVAMVPSVLLQAPPVLVSVNVVVLPVQTVPVPVIADGVVGKGLTVIVTVAAELPQLFVRV